MRVLVTETTHHIYVSFPGGVGPAHMPALDALRGMGARKQLPTRTRGWRWELHRARADELRGWLDDWCEEAEWVREVEVVRL